MKRYFLSLAYTWVLAALTALPALATDLPVQHLKISEPVFGEYTVGDDYFLGNYVQLLQYWDKLTQESDRIKLVEIGTTPEGRSMQMAIITSPENHKNLARYKDISVRLAKAEGLTDEAARALASEGKAVVWIDGGLHGTEVINSQALFTTAYDLVSRDDAETLRILDNVILLLVPANPDGMDLVSDWYMKESDPKKRNLSIPRLYQKYVGHDNNRDSYIANQLETEIINRQMYIEWIPQIMYNQHQTGPAGTVLFMAPFRDPFNYNHDPLVPIGIDLVGAAVHNRFLAEGKPGAVMRNAASYSTWFNGGDRTTVGFHNQIGLLSEIIGSPTPISIPLLSSKLLPNGDQPSPIGPRQEWHQRQSIEYVITADRAILDLAAKMREDFLYRIYIMGKNSIERGSQDYWTLTPKRIVELDSAYARDKEEQKKNNAGASQSPAREFGRNQGIPIKLWEQLRSPETRDPRGYIVPSNQVDFLTATKFINALLKAGVDVHRATKDFQVAGKSYPAGSYVVKAAQAFRPHLRDMFEPQDHPNDLQYPGGPPKPPYDLAGYTLAFQMGVQFDRILDGFDGPFEKISGLLNPPAGKIQGSGAVGYLLSHEVNDAFTGTTRLLADGEEIYWLTAPFTVNKKTYPAGTIYIPSKSSTRAHLQTLSDELGLSFEAIAAKPKGDALKIRPVKVGLWDRYGGSMDSGWIRWMLEQAFPFPFDVVYPSALDAGDLKSKYDVLIFPAGAVPPFRADTLQNARQFADAPNTIPDEYKDRAGNVTADKTVPQLRHFVEEGGTLLAIGGSTDFAYHLGLPVANALTEINPDGSVKKLPSEKFFIPGAVLRVKVDNTAPVAYGIPEELDLIYRNNPVFRLLPEAGQKGVNTVAGFSDADPLRSGWAWGQHYLNGSSAVVEAPAGKGRVFLFGPEITFRGQPHASFKFLFNSIYYAGATSEKLK
ncbi:Zinc carboxypeptidase [Bacteroidales bacterium Barb6]|nr:Zinc carboxypeptidase [Bacteroidales bacterium Barb6]